MPKKKIELSQELLQFIEALEDDDVPAARAMLDANPALVSTPIPDHFTEESEYPIHQAQSLQMIELLASRGADINAGDDIGQTPLHNARDLDTARLLVSLGANVNGTSATRNAPQHLQVEDPEVVEFLISQGADVSAKSEWDETPLHAAAEYDHDHWVDVHSAVSPDKAEEWVRETVAARLTSAKLLLDHGSSIEARDDYGRTPLHIAVKFNFPEMARLLLESGADLNSKDGSDETPLHYCAQYAGCEVAEALLSRGANVNARSKQGWYPLEMAMMHGRTDVSDLLRENGARPPKPAAWLFDAVYQRNALEVAELLTQAPKLVAARNGWSRTALNVAVRTGFEEGVKLLLDAGADPNAKDAINDRPLTIAVEGGSLEIARTLLEVGARTDIGFWHGKSGRTPLAEALGRRSIAMARLLIDSGAEVVTPCRGVRRETLLHLAAKRADLGTVKAIVERGADVNAVDERGWTPICYAASAGKIRVIRYLLRSGAEINAGKRGTVLLAAVGRGRANLVRDLIRQGADAKSAARGGVSALHYAAVQGLTDVIAILLDAGARINARLKENWQGPLRKTVPKGITPLGLALMARQQAAADYLRERGGITDM